MKAKVIKKFILLFAIFSIGIALGLFFWNKIELPFQNPWGVTGLLTKIRYNPGNDLIRFAVFILFPILILSVVYLLNIKKFRDICFGRYSNNFRCSISTELPSLAGKILAVILVIFTILVAFYHPTYHSAGRFDTYHEGETLGASVSYIDGKIPYKDFLFTHGIYQDPLRSIIAFKLFGRSIGSARTLQSIVKILTYLLLSVFLIKIYNGNYSYCFATLIIFILLHERIRFAIAFIPQFIPTLYAGFQVHVPQLTLIVARDITTFSFLITIPLLQKFIVCRETDVKKFFVINFVFSFIPLASFGYSIDRGFYLFAVYLIVSPLLYFFFFRRSIFRIRYLISSFLGLSSAMVLLVLLLRGGFVEFFKFTFLVMPRYKELMDGKVYPIHDVWFLAICILIAANLYWVILKLIKEFYLNSGELVLSIKNFMEKYLIEFCLLLLSIFTFRSALGRSDWEHVAYNSFTTYILSAYIFIKYYLHSILHRYRLNRLFTYFLVFLIISISSLYIYRIYDENLVVENFPFKIRDSEFIPANYKAAISFLKNNLNDEDKFVTMTSEASWYYFIDRPCPIRFPIVWFATPYFYQNEMVEGLQKSNVKFILYKNGGKPNRIDGFDNEIRLPIVIDYIKKNYVFFKKIDDNEIWIKNVNANHEL